MRSMVAHPPAGYQPKLLRQIARLVSLVFAVQPIGARWYTTYTKNYGNCGARRLAPHDRRIQALAVGTFVVAVVLIWNRIRFLEANAQD